MGFGNMEACVFEHLRENEARHWWHIGKYACALRLLKGLKFVNPRVLEIGASFGSFSRKISEFADCIALDYSCDAIRQGRYEPSVCGDAGGLPFKDGSFEIVVALDVIEHLKDDRNGVAEAIRVLRPEGILVILVPAYFFLWSDLDELSRHYRRYTPRSLKSLLLSFSDIRLMKLSHFNTFMFAPILIIRLLQRTIKRSNKSFSTESLGIPPGPINAVLKRIFLLEGRIVNHLNLPIGVSLIAVAKKRT